MCTSCTTQCNHLTSEPCKLCKEEGGVGHDKEHGCLQERVVTQVGELHQLGEREGGSTKMTPTEGGSSKRSLQKGVPLIPHRGLH